MQDDPFLFATLNFSADGQHGPTLTFPITQAVKYICRMQNGFLNPLFPTPRPGLLLEGEGDDLLEGHQGLLPLEGGGDVLLLERASRMRCPSRTRRRCPSRRRRRYPPRRTSPSRDVLLEGLLLLEGEGDVLLEGHLLLELEGDVFLELEGDVLLEGEGDVLLEGLRFCTPDSRVSWQEYAR